MNSWCWENRKTSIIRTETRTLCRNITWAIDNCKFLLRQLKESNWPVVMPCFSQGQCVYFFCLLWYLWALQTYWYVCWGNQMLDGIAVRRSSVIHSPIIARSWVTLMRDSGHRQMTFRSRYPKMKLDNSFLNSLLIDFQPILQEYNSVDVQTGITGYVWCWTERTQESTSIRKRQWYFPDMITKEAMRIISQIEIKNRYEDMFSWWWRSQLQYFM